jgi:hypothetical protein
MDRTWDYKEIVNLSRTKKPELVKMGLYPFDKRGHRKRERHKDKMLLRMAIARAKKYPPFIDEAGNLVLPYFYNVINPAALK